ncbi:MAG: ABC transporter permease [Thermodesulfobacteriota bacterium]
MQISENIHEALLSLVSSKQRTLLALLGIVIGIGSVIAMVSVGITVQEEAVSKFREMGTDIVSIRKSYSDNSRNSSNLKKENVFKIKHSCPGIQSFTPQTSVYGMMQYSGSKKDIPALGLTESAADIFKIDISQGRFISDLDENMFFCVIGSKVNDFLKKQGMTKPVGSDIIFKEKFFKIIGVAKNLSMNAMRPYEINQGIIIPLSTSFRFPDPPEIKSITAKISGSQNAKAASKQIENYFKTVDKTPVRVTTAEELIKKMQEQMRMFTILLGAIGSISLIVGGVGVMNIMLVSVTERKKEIGIRRALGAEKKDIQAQFLTESLILCLAGGFIGIILGLGASKIIAEISGWNFIFSITPVVLGAGVSGGVGLFFGFYPARQAAAMSPVKALQSD